MAKFLKEMLGLGDEGEAAAVVFGSPCVWLSKGEDVLLDSDSTDCQSYPSSSPNLRLRLRVDEACEWADGIPSPRQRGVILHKVLSCIRTAADIMPVLDELAAQGALSSQPQERQDYIDSLHRFLTRPDIAPWFDGSWTVRNEASILLPAGAAQQQKLRPDRVIEKDGRVVVIDYKFGIPRPEHQKQIDGYVQVLRDMGHAQVEGKIFYINS